MKIRHRFAAVLLASCIALSGCGAGLPYITDYIPAFDKYALDAPEEVTVTPVPTEAPAAPTPTAAPTPESTETPAPTEAPAAPTPTATPTPTPSPTPTPIPTEPIPEGMAKSTLTGEYITLEAAARRPIAFMIDNVSAAIPQSGIGSASVYYEATVEGEATRICAVFEDISGLKRIGPLRSCRDYFISFISGFDAIYEHYGQAAYALPYLESDDVDNISGLAWYTDRFFYRDNSFHVAPHNAYISDDGINGAIDLLGYRREHYEGYDGQLKFAWVGNEINHPEGQDAMYVGCGYPYSKSRFFYDPDTGLYTHYEYGGEHMDVDSGQVIRVKNVILEFENYAHYQDSEYLHFDTTSGGRGKYITNGKAIDITWERPSFYEPATYRTLDGEELTINTGKTFVCVIQTSRIRDCVMGASQETATCVVPEETAAEMVEYAQIWHDAYKWQEEEYLSIMAAEREMNVEKHGGKSKVASTYNTR